jgi:hypothetical protein
MRSAPKIRVSSSFWTSSLVSLGALGLLLGVPAAIEAQGVCSDPDNRSLNCDFATDINFWAQEYGSVFSHSSDGADGPGSIEITSQPAGDDLVKINQCVGGLFGLSSIDVGASFRIAAGPVEGCGVEATKYSDDNCTTYMGLSGFYNAVSASSWSRISGTLDLDPSIRGVRVSAICASPAGQFSVRIDDIYLGEGVSGAIFRDGFESGNTSDWTTAAP